MTKKLFSLLMALMVMVSVGNVSFNAFALDTDTPVDEEIIEEYKVIASNTSAIVIKGITAYCDATVTAQYSTSLKITMELQKKSSGTYSTVKTWTASKTGTTLLLSGTRTINVLSSYRLKTTFTAGSETITVYKYPAK